MKQVRFPVYLGEKRKWVFSMKFDYKNDQIQQKEKKTPVNLNFTRSTDKEIIVLTSVKA